MEKTKLILEILIAASEEIGVREESRNRGSRIREFWSAASCGVEGETNREPWCAAFIAWCVQKGATAAGVKFDAKFTRPDAAACFEWIKWSRKQDDRTRTFLAPLATRPKVGDIVVYKFSHIGIIETVASDKWFSAIEGNTDKNWSREGIEVARRARSVDSVKALIRFNV